MRVPISLDGMARMSKVCARSVSLGMTLFMSGTLAASGGPFDDLPELPCSKLMEFERPGTDSPLGWWLHGFGAGVISVDPAIYENEMPTVLELRDHAVAMCRENPNGAVTGSVMNRMYEIVR